MIAVKNNDLVLMLALVRSSLVHRFKNTRTARHVAAWLTQPRTFRALSMHLTSQWPTAYRQFKNEYLICCIICARSEATIQTDLKHPQDER